MEGIDRSPPDAESMDALYRDAKGVEPYTVILLTSQLGVGGAERHSMTLANLLCERFRVVMVYLKPEKTMIGQLDEQLLAGVHCLGATKRIDGRAARELAALADKHGARAVVCANAFALMYAQLARVWTRSPIAVVEIFHTTKPATIKEALVLFAYRPLFWLTKHLVFVCETQRRYWLRRGLWAGQTHMIYNGVDPSYFDPSRFEPLVPQARATHGFGVGDRVVGICAALRHEKAHADLVAAVGRLRSEGQNWKVLIIGDGPMRAAIEQQVQALGLQENVRITGYQADVREAVACCDVMALVSVTETFSIAALEAMAMGKPMIMSDVGGAREQISHGTHGLLFPAGKVPALADCLAHFWDKSRSRTMGAAARRRVEKEFSLQAMADSYAKLLLMICDESRRRQ